MTGAARVADLVVLYKALASRSRLRILALLARRPLCVNALARSLGISQPAVSQHLEVLRKAGLAAGERVGTMVHYRLERERVRLVQVSTAMLFGQSPEVARACSHGGPRAADAESGHEQT